MNIFGIFCPPPFPVEVDYPVLHLYNKYKMDAFIDVKEVSNASLLVTKNKSWHVF